MTRDKPGDVQLEQVICDDTEPTGGAPEPGRRRPYTMPQLDVYGPIQDLTLGGSVGVGESGMPSKKPLGAFSPLSNRPKKPSRPRNPSRK